MDDFVDSCMFDQWLKKSLKEMWSSTLKEPVPQDLLDLIKNFPQDQENKD